MIDTERHTAHNTPLVAPFRGERFGERAAWSALISPPYDVISPDRRADLLARHDRNVVRLILPDGDGDRYQNAAGLVARWRVDGTLVADTEPGVYVLRQTFRTPDGREHARTGVLAALAAEPYEGGRVRPHERTHRGPKEDRLALMRATETMFEALLMLAPDPDGALRDRIRTATLAPPLGEATLDGVEMAVWFVGGEDARALAETAGRRDIYIADGHHRYETAVAYRTENPAADHTLALIIPQTDPGLVVLPTHRMLTAAAPLEPAVPSWLGRGWDVRPLDAGEDPGSAAGRLVRGCVVATTAGAFTCRETGDAPPAAGSLDPAVERLNIARVDSMVVNPIKAATGSVLTYSPDPQEVLAAVRDRGAVGVLLPLTPVGDVIGVADAGGFMPQKSTYFQPKAPSGLVMMRVGA